MIKNILLGSLAILLIIGGTNMANAKTWDKTFPKSDKVTVQKVEFKNRFGITLVGDLYTPKSIKKGDKLPAIAVSGPFGAVKEQSSGLYAQTLAETLVISYIVIAVVALILVSIAAAFIAKPPKPHTPNIPILSGFTVSKLER